MYNKVWRVVVAGYPYHTPESLGVSDWTYAYQATKMAVYCVTGQGNVSDFYANDSIGQSIVDLINRLVYQGEHGGETYKTSLAEIHPVGEVEFNGNYYIQKYNLTSNLDLSNYRIAITNFPAGTIITDMNGNSKDTFNAGETFQVRMLKSEFEKQDVNGRIRGTIETKEYAVFYGTSYDATTQDYAITGDPIALNSCSTDLHIENNKSSIKIYKLNDDKTAPIQGVEFELLKDGNVIKTGVTDSNGVITFDKLYAGTYYVREKNTVYGYLLNSDMIEIQVNYNASADKQVTNEEPTGTIEIVKKDKETGSTAQGDATLENAIYKVYANEDIYNVAKTKKFYSKGDLVATRTTNAKGEAEQVTDLPLGKYLVKEEKAPTGYLIDEKQYPVDLIYKDQHTKVITGNATSTDQVKKMQVHIYKSGIKENNGLVPGLQGAEFTIKLYKDVEKALKEGYSYAEIWGGLDEDGNQVKVDSKRVAQAQVIAPSYDSITTDENGDAYTKQKLPYGRYWVKETITPKDFYTATDFSFSITQDESEIQEVAKKVKHLYVNDEQIESYIKLVKKDADSGKIVTLNSATFQIKATKDIYDRGNGKIVYKKGEVITQKIGSTVYNSFTTNSQNLVVPEGSYNNNKEDDGTVITPLKLPVGEYEIAEIKIPTGYLELENPLTFKIENLKDYDQDNSGDFIKTIEINNAKPTGTIVIDKSVALRQNADTSLVDISDLRGIEFKLSAKEDIIDMADGSIIYKKGQEIKKYNVDKKGDLEISNLPMGSYILEETKTLDGLVLNTDKMEVTFTQKDTKTKVYTETRNVVNDTTFVEISKTDITGDKELEGAKLTILDGDKVIDEWTSTDKAHTIEGLIVGKEYTLREEYAPENYVVATDIKFTVNADKETQKVQMIDKIVEMTKKNIAGEELEGATIVVTNTKTKNIVDKWVSEKEPHKIQGLIEGQTYIMHEEIAIDGYVKATDIEFTVSEDKETQKIEMIDKVVTISKTDLVTGKELPGAELEVKDEDGNIIDKWISTDTSHNVTGLEEGKKYTLTEVTCPYGYEIAETIEFEVTADKETQVIEMKDMPILKTIKVIKADSDTKETIKANFKFGIYEDPECTKLIKEVKSDKENGIAVFEDLRYGTYYIKETKAPNGYQLSDKVVKIEINDKGTFADGELLEDNESVCEFTYYNKLIPKIHTGNEMNYVIIIVSIVISLLGITTGIVVLKKKKQKNN